MLRRKQVVQHEIIARHMQRFFRTLPGERQRDPETIARSYGQFLWDRVNQRLIPQKSLLRSRFNVSLSIGDNSQDLESLTKRAALISDTLLLSHNKIGSYCDIADSHNLNLQRPVSLPSGVGGTPIPSSIHIEIGHQQARWDREHLREMYGMYCPSLDKLGRWLLDAEPLLKAGMVWYLPSYATARYKVIDGVSAPLDKDAVAPATSTVIDYLVRDGRAVDASGAEPIKSKLVHPMLRIDLPFFEGVNLQDFSRITIGEFAAYSAFRDFLRQSFLDMDMAINAVQSEHELLRLSLQIKDHVRSVRSKMETARRKKSVAVTGAVIGSVGAILVAVYGPALAAAIAAIGASGGVWGIIHAASENSTRALREDKWYYVWALAEKSNVHVI